MERLFAEMLYFTDCSAVVSSDDGAIMYGHSSTSAKMMYCTDCSAVVCMSVWHGSVIVLMDNDAIVHLGETGTSVPSDDYSQGHPPTQPRCDWLEV